MNNTTRVMFQSSLNYLNSVNKIYVLNEGQIVNSGTFLEIQNSPIYKEISQKQLGHFNDDLNEDDEEEKSLDSLNKNNQLKLQNIKEVSLNRFENSEDQKEGKVESWVYKKVYEQFGGGCTAFLFIICNIFNIEIIQLKIKLNYLINKLIVGLVSTYFQMAQFTILK